MAKSFALHLLPIILLLLQATTAKHGLAAATSVEGRETVTKRRRRNQQPQYPSKTRHDVKLFEGDIVPDYNQMLECYGTSTTAELVAKGILEAPGADNDSSTASSLTTPASLCFNRWPTRIEDVTVIPYEFAVGAFTADEQRIVKTALRDLAQQVNVLEFVPRRENSSKTQKETNQRPYLRFTADKIPSDEFSIPCWTQHVGWNGGSHQDINLGEAFCVSKGPVQHLLMHTLGSWEPTSRWDRDDYITIVWENVMPGLEFNLQRRTWDDTLGFPYFDYGSLMNNANDDYSKNGKDTILSPVSIGQLVRLSAGDVLWVRLLYQCQSGPRVYGDYLAHPCTEDCPCWRDDKSRNSGHDKNDILEVAMSCGGNNAACQGNLVCSPQTDRCVRPRSDTIADTETMWFLHVDLAPKRVTNMLVVVACIGIVLSLILVRAIWGIHGTGWFAPGYRRGYAVIP